MRVRRRVRTLIARCCTGRKIGPVVVVDEVGRHALEAADKRKIEGIEGVPTTVPEPSEARGVKVASETGKESPRRNADIVARNSMEKVSAGRSAPSWKNPNPAEPNKEIGSARTTSRAQKEPEMDRAQPS